MIPSACCNLRRARSWGGRTAWRAAGLARCLRQKRRAKYDTAATANAPSTLQSQNQPDGISTGALMSRMSPADAFVPTPLVAEDGAGMMTADELVFIGRGNPPSSHSL